MRGCDLRVSHRQPASCPHWWEPDACQCVSYAWRPYAHALLRYCCRPHLPVCDKRSGAGANGAPGVRLCRSAKDVAHGYRKGLAFRHPEYGIDRLDRGANRSERDRRETTIYRAGSRSDETRTAGQAEMLTAPACPSDVQGPRSGLGKYPVSSIHKLRGRSFAWKRMPLPCGTWIAD